MPKRKPKPIGEQLKAARQARGLKQHQVAAAAGIDQSLLSKIELSKRQPSIVQMCDLALVLGATFIADGKRTTLELEE